MDNIYENNFYAHGEGAWHNKGRVGQENESAEQVYGQMKQVLFHQVAFPAIQFMGASIPNNTLAILRVEGDKVALIGNTKQRYQLLQRIEYIKKFDVAVGKPVETLGFLGQNADKLFLTWNLPKIDIYGDIMKLYGLLSFGFDGKYGNHLYLTEVRTVCSNTHARAVADATKTKNQGFGADSKGAMVTVKHTEKDHLDKLGYWMKFADAETDRQAKLSQALFRKMEKHPLTLDEAFGFFSKVYPYPADARTYIPPELVAVEQSKHAEDIKYADESRQIAVELFSGAGIEITHTLYGAYNSVTELENLHRMAKKNDGTESILIGARGARMDKAFAVALDYLG